MSVPLCCRRYGHWWQWTTPSLGLSDQPVRCPSPQLDLRFKGRERSHSKADGRRIATKSLYWQPLVTKLWLIASPVSPSSGQYDTANFCVSSGQWFPRLIMVAHHNTIHRRRSHLKRSLWQHQRSARKRATGYHEILKLNWEYQPEFCVMTALAGSFGGRNSYSTQLTEWSRQFRRFQRMQRPKKSKCTRQRKTATLRERSAATYEHAP